MAGDRTDPLEILALQATTRLPDLVPIRYGRMAASPFAFFRGAAAVMAADLDHAERTGLEVQLCGDAHLSNFGGFASPERDLIFDVNDFDETIPGPFEWDLKRLAASLEIAAGAASSTTAPAGRSWPRARAPTATAIREFAAMRDLAIWSSHLDAAAIAGAVGRPGQPRLTETFQRRMAKAQSKDHLAALAKLTTEVDGSSASWRTLPLLMPAESVFTDVYSKQTVGNLYDALPSTATRCPGTASACWTSTSSSIWPARWSGWAAWAPGAGWRCSWAATTATRCFSRSKRRRPRWASRSSGPSEYAQHGQRVVEGQRLMQGASDIFLGWDAFKGDDGVTRDFYLRQLWDWKFSVDMDAMSPEAFGIYAQICGWTLARAHARSGDAIAIGSYLGGGDRFDRCHVRVRRRLRRSERAGLRIPDPGHRRPPDPRHHRRLSGPRPRTERRSSPTVARPIHRRTTPFRTEESTDHATAQARFPP